MCYESESKMLVGVKIFPDHDGCNPFTWNDGQAAVLFGRDEKWLRDEDYERMTIPEILFDIVKFHVQSGRLTINKAQVTQAVNHLGYETLESFIEDQFFHGEIEEHMPQSATYHKETPPHVGQGWADLIEEIVDTAWRGCYAEVRYDLEKLLEIFKIPVAGLQKRRKFFLLVADQLLYEACAIDNDLEKMGEVLRKEVNLLEKWVKGDVWGFEVTDGAFELDAGYGIIGRDEAEKEAREAFLACFERKND